MPGALLEDEMGLGKTFPSVAAVMIRKQLTEKVVMGLLLSTLWGNTHEEWVSIAQKNFPGIIGEERAWYPLWRQNSVPHRFSKIQSTPLQGHTALISSFEPILVVTMPGVAETFKSVIDEMTSGTNCKLINSLHTENAILTQENLKTSIEEPEN